MCFAAVINSLWPHQHSPNVSSARNVEDREPSPWSMTSSNGCRSTSPISIVESLAPRHRFERVTSTSGYPTRSVIATAIEHSADELITTDRKWPTARALKLDITITHL